MDKDFRYPQGKVINKGSLMANDYFTQGAAGIGWVGEGKLLEYLVSGGNGSPGSLVHSVVFFLNRF